MQKYGLSLSSIDIILTVSLVNSEPGFYRDSYCFIVAPACCKPETDNTKVNIFDVLCLKLHSAVY